MRSRRVKYEPTPEQIKSACEKFRSSWTERETTTRTYTGRHEWAVPEFKGTTFSNETATMVKAWLA